MLQIIIQLMEGKFPRFSRWGIPLNFEGFCTVSLALAGFLKSRICHFPPGSFPSHCIKYLLNFGIFPNMLQIIIQLMEGKFPIVSWWVLPLNCEGFCTASLALAGFLKSRIRHFPPGIFPSSLYQIPSEFWYISKHVTDYYPTYGGKIPYCFLMGNTPQLWGVLHSFSWSVGVFEIPQLSFSPRIFPFSLGQILFQFQYVSH